MIEVNLLPGGKKRATRGGPKLSFKMPTMDTLPTDPWILGGAAVVVLVVAVAAFLYLTTNSRHAELVVSVDGAVADSARYYDLIQQNEALNARRDSIARRVSVIQDIDGDRYVWPHVMDEVARALPEYTWLINLLQTAGGEEIQFRLEGRAGNPFALARFMENLEASLFIRNVDLISTVQEIVPTGTGANRTVNGFTLEASFERPPVELLETVPLFEEEASEPAETESSAQDAEDPEAEPSPPDTAVAPGETLTARGQS